MHSPTKASHQDLQSTLLLARLHLGSSFVTLRHCWTTHMSSGPDAEDSPANQAQAQQPGRTTQDCCKPHPIPVPVALHNTCSCLLGSLRIVLQVALALRQALKDELGLTVSCGVARNRLLARLVGPLHKPDCATVLPDAGAVPFIRSQPLRHVPSLRCAAGVLPCLSSRPVCQCVGVLYSGALQGCSLVPHLGSPELLALEQRSCAGRLPSLSQTSSQLTADTLQQHSRWSLHCLQAEGGGPGGG